MKTNYKYIVLGLLMSAAISVTARNFETGERLYFNGTPSSASWWKNDAELWCDLKNGGSDYWLQAKWPSQEPYVPYIEIPSAAAGEWTHIVMARCKPGDRNTIYNKTGEISFFESKNYMENFYYGEDLKEAYWGSYIPAPEGNPSSWSYDNEEICTDAAGTDFVLAPKNYDYSDKTQNHAWFEYDGGNWIRRQEGATEWVESGDKNYTVTLGSAGYDKYFFYQCSTPSMCRLVRIRLNQDCSEGAPGACKITSFIAVASDANVTDQTCAVDGLVAFDDKLNAGDLMIWCEGVDAVTIANGDLEMPQTFKLKGFDASSTKTYTLHTKFLNGTSACEATCMVTVKPPTAPITTHTTTGTAGDENLVRFTEEDVKLTPNNQTSTYFQWTNSANEEVITTGDRNHTFTAPTEGQTIDYVFLATNDPPAPEGNLISNGTFEDPALDGNLESDYDRWGRDNHEYYTANPGASGGYAITNNANYFWHDYQNVSAHEGSYFGLFDSKIYDSSVGDQAAWIARSGTRNPKLKVQAGISYLFSFWVANINTYYQMDNGARLQFQISYDGGSSWNNLGSEINLGNFKDSHWHGMSSIATPSVSSTNVVLRVINLNHSTINIGNDFALDDIRFEAVTSRSSNIAAFERFPVTYLQCKITSATFTQKQPAACGKTTADVNYRINFENPRGDLYIYEGTTELAHIAHADLTMDTYHQGVLSNQPVDNAEHTLTVYFKDALVQSPNPGATFTYDAKAVPAISVNSLEWTPLPECDVPTATLKAVINYTNQNGTLSANVDGGTPVSQSYAVESDDETQVTLIIPGIVADGKAGHKLNISFSGSHGCAETYVISTAAPYMPQVVSTTAAVQPYQCGIENYQVEVTVNYTNAQDHDLIITDEAGHTVTLHSTDPTYASPATYTFNMPWEAVASHTFKAYFADAESCKDNASHLGTYTKPAQPVIAVAAPTFSNMDCDKSTYTLSAIVTYTNQDGTLYAWLDDDTANKKSFTYNQDKTTSDDVTIVLNDLVGDGAAHQLNVEFDGPKGCRRVIADGNAIPFTAPFTPVIGEVNRTTSVMACGATTYTVTVDIPFSANAIGKTLTITGDTGTEPTTYPASTPFSHTFTVNKANATGKFNIYFADAENCETQKTKDYPYTIPTVPGLSVNIITVPAPACNFTTFDLSISGTYSNLHGDQLEFWWDGVKTATQSITPLTSGTIAATITGVVYDGLTHELQVKSNNTVYDNCPDVQNIVVPFSPSISGENATPTQMNCGETTYDVEVAFTVANGQGKNVTVAGKGQTKSIAAVDGVNTVTFNAIGVSDVTADQFEIWFADNTDCTTHKVATYTKPVEPVIAVAAPTFSNMDCSKSTYTLSAVVTYTNQDGTLYAWLDDDTANKKSFTYNQDKTTSDNVTIVLDDLVGDGAAHQLNIEFDGPKGCRRVVADGNAIAFTAPFTPVISGVTITPSTMACGTSTYTVTVAAAFSANAIGKTLTITGDTGVDPTTYTASTPFSHTFTVNKADATGKFRIYFADAENCEAQKTNDSTYTIPTVPGLSVNIVTVPAPACNVTTFNLSISGTYSNLHGDQLEFLWDGVKTTTQSITPLSSGTIAATITGVVYDGKTHVLQVKSNDNVYDNCPEEQTINVPLSLVIDQVNITDVPTGKLPCGTTDYTINVVVTTHFDATGYNVQVAYDENGTPKTVVVPATGKVTTITLTLTNMGDVAQAVTASIQELPGCSKDATYTPPTLARITPNFDVNVSENVCDVLNYTVSGTIQFDQPDGNLIVQFDPAHSQTIAVPAGSTSVNFSIPGMTDNRTGLTLRAWFENGATPACTVVSNTFDAPAVPSMDIRANITSMAACATKAEVTFSVDYTYQQGQMEYWIDDQAHQTKSITEKSAAMLTENGLTLSDFDADGKTHTIHVKFNGPNSCEETETFTAPFSPAIDQVDITGVPTGKLPCSTADYTINVVVTTHFDATGYNVQVAYDENGTPKTVAVPATSKVTTIPLKLTNMGDVTQTITASIQELPGCSKDATYTPPSLAHITPNFDVNVSETACGGLNYTVSGTVQFDQPDGNLIVQFDPAHSQTIAVPAGSTSVNFSIPGMTDSGTGLTLQAWFDNSATPACTAVSNTFDAPAVPNLSVNTITVPALDCDVTTFDLSISGTYSNLHGDQLEFWWDGVKTTTQSITPLTSGTIAATITGVVYDGLTHELQVKSNNTVYDNCPDMQNIVVPFSPSISGENATPTQMNCGETTYDVEVAFTVANGQGKNVTVAGKGQTKSIAAVDGVNTVTFNAISATDATPDQFEIWFADNTDCTTHKVATYTKPVEPVIAVAAPTFSNMDCDKSTYTLSAIVTYTNQDGTLYAWLDDDTANKKIFTYNQDKTTSDNVTIVLNDLVGDGAAHQLNIEFEGAKGCRRVIADGNAIPFTAPFTPVIGEVNMTTSVMACGATTYTVTVDIPFSANAIGKTLTITGDTGVDPTTYTASTPFSHTFTVNKADATGKFRIYFADAENCEAQKTNDYTYTIPTVPGLSVNIVTVPAPACNVTTFNLSISGTYSNLHGDQLEFWWDGVKTTTQSITSLSSGTIAATITGVVYDGQTHELQVKSNNTVYDNCPDVQNIVVPFSPSISGEKATPTQMNCGETTYDVEVSFTVANGQGKSVTVAGKGQTKNVTAVEGINTVTFNTIGINDATADQFEIWFADNTDCTTHKVATYTKPVVPKLENIVETIPTTIACDATTFDVTVDFDYTYQDGTLDVNVDDTYKATITPAFVPNSPTSQTATATITGIPADGTTSHKLNIVFTGGTHSCDPVQILFDAPYSSDITSMTITDVPSTVTCGTTAYSATVNLTTRYKAIGEKIKLSYKDKGGATDTTVTVKYPDNADKAGTTISFKLALHNMDAASQTIDAAFVNASECSISATYTPPTVLSCNKEYASVCEGDSYFWSLTGTSYTAKVGTDTFTNPLNNKDTLFLTGIELPRISVGTIAVTCDDENAIRIPFTGTTGIADSIDIAVGTNNYTGSIVGSDIVFTRATELVAGDYSAVVTIGTKGYTCTQVVPIKFSVALGGLMYSKWTDVLFVSNADNNFVAYQWYENGVAMTGETKQSLYRPEGLPGLYYCQLVTKDGKTLNTCEKAFDDVQPSREESTKQAKVVSTTLYDPMGRVLQARPTQGIYIVFEELDNGETRAYKIATYE